MKKIILTAAVAFLVAAPALAADCESVRPDLLSRAQQMAQNSRDRAIKDFSESSAATLEGGSPGQTGQPGAGTNASSSNCLEKYKDVKVGSMIGVPSVNDLAKQALDRVSQAACTSIDSVYGQAAGSMKQSIMLPGNIGGAQVGLPGAYQLGNPYQSPNTVSVPGVDVSVKKSSGGIIQNTISGIPSYIKGIFQ